MIVKSQYVLRLAREIARDPLTISAHEAAKKLDRWVEEGVDEAARKRRGWVADRALEQESRR